MIKWLLILLSMGFCRADLNRDGRVDNRDLVIFAQEWLMADTSIFTDDFNDNSWTDVWTLTSGQSWRFWERLGEMHCLKGTESVLERKLINVSSGGVYSVEFEITQSSSDTSYYFLIGGDKGESGEIALADYAVGIHTVDVVAPDNGTIKIHLDAYTGDEKIFLNYLTVTQSGYLCRKICDAIKAKFDAGSFTYINALYFEKAKQDAGLDYAVFHWIDSTQTKNNLESVTVQFNIYMIAVDDVGATIQEFTDTFDWCTLTVPGYDFVKMERESTRNMQFVDDVWQIVLTYEILVSY